MPWHWIIFIGFVLLMLALDLGVFHRQSHVVGFGEAMRWSAVWVGLGLLFSIFVYYSYELHWFGVGHAIDAADGALLTGKTAAVKYLTGYVVEKSLSVDNIFVIAMIFSSFAVPARYQHRVLFWGILGALVMRGAMIGVGATLIAKFHWILYVFGGFLILTALKMFFVKEGESDPQQGKLVKLIRRLMPVTAHYHGQHFMVKAGSPASCELAEPGAKPCDDPEVQRVAPGTWMLTPLAVALILVEVTDLIFAVDSIPAIFAITAEPYLVFTSNVFAILGLRSLYFALAGMMHRFRYLKPALAAVLMIVGVKMLAASWLKGIFGVNFNFMILGLIVAVLALGVIASLCIPEKKTESPVS